MTMDVNFDDVFENVMMNAIIAACESNGVLDGLAVSENGAGADMSVDVAAGNCMIDGVKSTESSTTNLAISAANATYDRKDLVVYDSSAGDPAVVTGTAAATPVPPDIPSGDILLAIVNVAAGVTQITNADIVDGIVIVSQPGVSKTLFDAYTMLYADTDDTPAALSIPASTFVGRKDTGGIAAMTASEVETLLTGVMLKDGTRTMTGPLDMGGHNIIGVADLVLKDATIVTIDSSGILTISQSYHIVNTYDDAATDDLAYILPLTNGQILILEPNGSDRTVVIKNGTGNIYLAGSDFSLDHANDRIVLMCTSDAGWFELSRSNNG